MLKQVFPNKTVLLLFCAILILGSIFRFYGLENQSLWTDELASWKISGHAKVADMYTEIIDEDTHPPGYYLFLHYLMKYVGDSELVLRLPSAIGGLLAIIAIYLLGLRVYSYKEGLIAAALVAVLNFPIYYSQEARAYSFLILFTILST